MCTESHLSIMFYFLLAGIKVNLHEYLPADGTVAGGACASSNSLTVCVCVFYVMSDKLCPSQRIIVCSEEKEREKREREREEAVSRFY